MQAMQWLAQTRYVASMKYCWEFSCVTDNQGTTWWRHQMETFSTLLALCVGNSPVTGEFPSQRPVTRSFRVFFVLSLNKCLWGWWFEMPSCSLWHHCNEEFEKGWHWMTLFSCPIYDGLFSISNHIICQGTFGSFWYKKTVSQHYMDTVYLVMCLISLPKPLLDQLIIVNSLGLWNTYMYQLIKPLKFQIIAYSAPRHHLNQCC